jgi:hypothetical protein
MKRVFMRIIPSDWKESYYTVDWDFYLGSNPSETRKARWAFYKEFREITGYSVTEVRSSQSVVHFPGLDTAKEVYDSLLRHGAAKATLSEGKMILSHHQGAGG